MEVDLNRRGVGKWFVGKTYSIYNIGEHGLRPGEIVLIERNGVDEIYLRITHSSPLRTVGVVIDMIIYRTQEYICCNRRLDQISAAEIKQWMSEIGVEFIEPGVEELHCSNDISVAFDDSGRRLVKLGMGIVLPFKKAKKLAKVSWEDLADTG